ncbi:MULTISPECIES: type VI secretion system lipoprotein TssJ [unclassified Janthinobacterium]|uniref:type VI secretion system lipoprotein TssJ n=1 Tax=unclassified Janthinobacterium TaxID=2610881 RepID=UPI000C11695D|nr:MULTISPECIES: type VI secretion system lipoprotein TssJ [unclassified Janthinobacterium]MDZ5635489.1 type VI secretion system lipoprotein TssJ [Janthinobacterium sp. GMG1]PHV27662.1 type VI secretion system lipoprotein TssJ [Janthinobacterium sp. BJB426]
MPIDAPLRRLARSVALLLLVLPQTLLLAGCAGGAIGTLANAALQMAGVAKPPPELPDAQKPPRNVSIRLHAAQRLNTDADGRPLALVARIYKLRQSAAFEQAPYDSFLDTQREKVALGADLMEVKEVLLVPGQRYEVQEKVSKEAYFIGVVALFRAPAAQRWRATFAAADAERGGITVGLHACALSVSGMAALSAPRCH